MNMVINKGGGGWVVEWLGMKHLSVFHSVSNRVRETCLFRGSLCFQLVVLVSNKRLYDIHVT